MAYPLVRFELVLFMDMFSGEIVMNCVYTEAAWISDCVSVLLWIDKVNQLFFYTVLYEIYLQNIDT